VTPIKPEQVFGPDDGGPSGTAWILIRRCRTN